MFRLLLLVLAASSLLCASAAAQTTSAVDVGAVGESLRADPLYVDPSAERGLSADEADRVRAALARAGDVRVAVLPADVLDGSGPAAEATFMRALYGATGLAGTYGAVVGDRFLAGSTELRPGRAAVLAGQALGRRSEGTAAVLEDFASRVASARAASGGGGAGPTSGGRPGAGGDGSTALILLGVFGGGGALWLAARSRARRRREAEELEDLRLAARDELVALGDDVRALDLDLEMPGVAPAAREDLATALARYERAETAVDRARRPEDFAGISEAIAEGRYAMARARARLEGRPLPEHRPPCFFDPRHGPSTRDVEWAPAGGQPRPVPVCEADAIRVEEGVEPAFREVAVGGAMRPYVAAGPAFGPWAGGWFGGFGGGGLIPGMLGGMLLADLMTPDVSWGGGFDGGGGGLDGGGFDGGGFGDFGGGDFGGGDFGGGDF